MVSISLILKNYFGLYTLNIIIRLLLMVSSLLIFLSFFILVEKYYHRTIITPMSIFILVSRNETLYCLCYKVMKDLPTRRTPKNSFQG